MLEQIRVSVKANVPLSPAFAAAAQDYLVADTGFSPQRIARICKLAGLGILMLLAMLGALDSICQEGAEALPELIPGVVIAAWLMINVIRQRHKPAAVFTALQSHVESGHTLSEAMNRLPRFFPRNLIALAEMGERTGTLDDVLDRFSSDTIAMYTGGRELRRVLWYFGIGIVVQISIILFFMVKVVPVFYELFAELGVHATAESPAPHMFPIPSTNLLVAIADFLAYKGPFLIFILGWSVSLWLWIRPKFQRRSWASRKLATPLLAVPGIRGMVARQNLGTAAFMLQQMLQAGVPLERALDAVANADLHRVYRHWFARVRKRVLNGDSLKDACSGIRLATPVPRSFTSLLAMGEAHGRLESALAYIAENYRGQVERRRKLLVSCVLPLGVFIMGYITLSMAASMFQMLTAAADAVMP
ncbi:MAG: type II secretion system F family protein [Candidatus Hydrogenedentes bacterium]|nr:type II secretion system F family protein [Candidatus Hydrogenedentota bacterium]